MDLSIGKILNDTVIIISLFKIRTNYFRITVSKDCIVEEDGYLSIKENEAVKTFQNIQKLYFGEILNLENFTNKDIGEI